MRRDVLIASTATLLLATLAVAQENTEGSFVKICGKFENSRGPTGDVVLTMLNYAAAGGGAHNFTAKVDETSAILTVTGGYYGGGPKDGRESLAQSTKISGVEPRRYYVVHNGTALGPLDLSERSRRDCVGSETIYDERPDESGGRHLWNRLDVDASMSGPTPIDAVETFFAAVIGARGGFPSVSIKVRSRGEGKLADVEVFGLGDDSIDGEWYRARLSKGGNIWRVDELFRRHMCARGERAGQWTHAPCP